MTDSDEVKLLPWSFEARLSSDGLAWEVVDVTNAADPILVAVFDSKGAADDFHEENAKIAAAALNARQFGLTRPPVVTDEVVERLRNDIGYHAEQLATYIAQSSISEKNLASARFHNNKIRAALASMPAVVSGSQSLGDHALPPSGLSQSSLSQAKPAAAIARRK